MNFIVIGETREEKMVRCLGLLFMEINFKGAEKSMQKRTTYCSNYLPLFWKNAKVYISQVFNQRIESLFLSRWLETINNHRRESKSANNSLYWNK